MQKIAVYIISLGEKIGSEEEVMESKTGVIGNPKQLSHPR